MNRRDEALTEALQRNDAETRRWEMFLKENETAIENMTAFGKRLTLDVMVPIGKKALMPGHLLHTNEVLVGHYQGYFSKCTSIKAKEICEFRIKMAKEHLEKLKLEAELWQNKLDKPYAEGVIPSGEELDIIEEYNEETEILWGEDHRNHIKQAKQKERENREKMQYESTEDDTRGKTNEDIFKMLDEAELMEELEQELDALEVEELNDDMLRKLMSGEMKLPNEKMRLAHDKDHKEKNEKSLSPNIVKIKDLKNSSNIRTNNNVMPNQALIRATHGEECEEDEEDTLPEEVQLIKQQAKYLNVEDQIGFYDYQIQIIRQKIQLLPLRTPQELHEKIHLLNVLEYLEELLEEAEESVGQTELDNKDRNVENYEIIEERYEKSNGNSKEEESKCDVENKSNQKRRISFALEDQTLEFRKNEAVTQMLPPKIDNKSQRDVIYFDNAFDKKDCNVSNVKNSSNKQILIKEKVEKNLQFVEENQSKQDFDLVQKILQTSEGEVNTLHIKFNHSKQEGYDNKPVSNTIGSPADIYTCFINSQQSSLNESSTFFVNSYKGEEKVKVPVLKETDRLSAFADPKSEFSNPLQAKPILKNKSSVNNENHNNNPEETTNVKKSNKKDDDDLLSAYNKVMNEVIERPLTEPEPLPDVKYIDAHTPKKRISRFKQMRQDNGKT